MRFLPVLLALCLSAPCASGEAASIVDTADHVIPVDGDSGTRNSRITSFNELSDPDKQVLVMGLIRYKKTEILELLLNTGFDTDYFYQGVSPLAAAIAESNLDIVKMLVTNGADLELKDKDKETALKIAVRRSDFEIVDYLLGHGADANAAGKGDSTPLTTAVFKGDKPIIELLIRHGADVEHDNWSLLHYAANYKHVHLIDYLLEQGIDVNSRTKDGWSPIALASSKGNIEVVEKLLLHSPDIEIPAIKSKMTALMAAAAKGHSAIVQKLLVAGADPERENKNEHGALWLAANNSHLHTVKTMLETVKNADRVFLDASSKGDFEVARILLKSGVDIQSRTSNGSTAMHLAARHGHLNIVRFLHKNGADIHAIATEKKDTPLMRAAGWGKKDVLKYLVEQGAEVDTKSQAGWTAVLSTARHHSLSSLKFLVRNGADIHETTNSGWTILMLAAKGKKRNTIKYLLGQNLDLALKNKKGQSALDIAKHSKDTEIIEMIETASSELW